MRCHYEILGISLDSDSATIKTAYKKCALKWHPDKNLDNIEKAKEEFQLVQQAYEVLSDPQERAWYDNHREAILKGGFGDNYKDDSLNLFPYFSASCYQGYGDDDKGFYAVYREVFNKIYAEDWNNDNEDDVDDDDTKVPEFGYSYSSYEEVVHPFYAYWENYCTNKSFVWLDEFDIREAPNRRVMRLMEKENKKVRDKARKERNEEIRTLVKFVRKRDKRLDKHRKYLEEKAAENAKKVELDRLRQLQERNRQIAESKQAEWSKMENIEHELKEIEANLANEFGERHSQEACSDDEDGIPLDQLYCVACNKTFKTEKSFANHENSKKHKDNVSALKIVIESNEMKSSDDDILIEENSDADEIPSTNNLDEDNLSTNGEIPNLKKKSKGKKVLKAMEECVDILSSEDSDDDFSKSYSKKQKKKGSRRKASNSNATNNTAKSTEVQDDAADLVNEEISAKSNQESVNTSKKVEKKNKGKKQNKTVEDSTKDLSHTCATCETIFPSKNKLFQHLKTSGHSIYLPKTVINGKEKVPSKLKKEEYKH